MEFYISLGAFLLLGVYIYKNTKRQTVQPFPAAWHNLLLDNVIYYRKLPKDKQIVFQQRIMKFLSEVYIDGVELEITDLDKILIASSAVIPVFGFDDWHYNNLSGVLLYPDYFNKDLDFADTAESRNIGGLVGNGRFENKMILSRKALHHGFMNTTDKNNTGIHEFVHLIDKMDGSIDGVPKILLTHQYAIPWLNIIHEKMEAINNDKSDIREYGGTKQAEFFAVASEYFFERPDLLKRKHPKLYKMMMDCFSLKK
ncbi:peptidase [Flavobacterium arcticum]|uniref:Peptidase n=1 Tax=Flavobacterium arcticum TaxID=1784713 RepID=A0A345H8U6_9FLAO|nr:M90 family metallopeptidase [Flavobacterium arcticum]AXG73006.1 peptidase [Flavobacterium arcticum]KAF2510331.1 zinc-dependent peptidase [Flavobacterium arcticum]